MSSNIERYVLQILQNPDEFFRLFDNTTITLSDVNLTPLDQSWIDDSQGLNPSFFYGGFAVSNHTIPMQIFEGGIATSKFAGNGVYPGEYTLQITDSYAIPCSIQTNDKLMVGIQLSITVPAAVNNIQIVVEPTASLSMRGYMVFETFPLLVSNDYLSKYPQDKQACQNGTYEPSIVCNSSTITPYASDSPSTVSYVALSIGIVAFIIVISLLIVYLSRKKNKKS